MYSNNRIGNRKFYSKLQIIVFEINSISLIESEELRETSDSSGHPNWTAERVIIVSNAIRHKTSPDTIIIFFPCQVATRRKNEITYEVDFSTIGQRL